MPYLLTVTAQPHTADQLRRIFALERDFTLAFTQSGQEALRQVGQEADGIHLILVDEHVDGVASLELIRKLAILAPEVPIVVLADEHNVEYVREALLAGARAFIMKPLQDADVIATVQQLIALEQARREQRQAPQTLRGRTITVASPKGGTGKTMLAINLAVALREQTGKSVILIDGQSSLGDLDVVLNLQAKYTCADVLPHMDALDAELLTGVLAEHVSGVRVLASSPEAEDADRMTPEIFEQLLEGLRGQADYLIVDAGSLFEPQTAVALETADEILLVITPEVTCLRRLALFLNAANRNDFPVDKLHFILNRDDLPGGLHAEDIREYVNVPLRITLPDDPALVTYSLNRGIPLVTSSPRSVLARRIRSLAEQLSTPSEHTQRANGAKPLTGGLLGRLATMWRNNK
ncbi:MAG: response regulator [Chloroflexi bacterium]|nr:MAG: response regulator [Chloroflexota bacterium]